MENPCEDFPDEIQEKIAVWVSSVSRNSPVTIVTGVEGSLKDMVIECMINHFLKLRVSFKTYYPAALVQDIANDIVHPAFLYILYDGEMVNNYKMNELKTFLANHVRESRALIIDCPDMDSLERTYGKDFIDFLSSRMVEVVLPTKRQEHFTI